MIQFLTKLSQYELVIKTDRELEKRDFPLDFSMCSANFAHVKQKMGGLVKD
jgi:hypothetical protein